MSVDSKMDIRGQAPFKQSGVYEVQISIVNSKPTDDQIKTKQFSSLWKGNYHLRVKDGLFSETLGSSENPIPESVKNSDKIWVIVSDLFSSLSSTIEIELEGRSRKESEPSSKSTPTEKPKPKPSTKQTSDYSPNAGPQGPMGERGPPGEEGDKGPQGPPGIQGERGPSGEKGPLGSTGDKGDKGPTGDKGPSGDKGLTGERGPTGDKGLTGDKGDKGDKGPQGPTGDKGEKGPTGQIGDKGPSGDRKSTRLNSSHSQQSRMPSSA